MIQLYYTSLTREEKQELLDKIVATCECRETTARAWCRESRRPNPLAQKEIAGIIGISREKLFPKKIRV